ncbi:MAG TPA: hypothetical protein VK610_04845 [Rhodothermales bacterium]|nr:hypothetical protein [Rhodothermales bacterium]
MRPTRPSAALAVLLLVAGCRDPEGEREPPPPDSTLVAVLTELHLADARAETTGASRDSLRRVAFEAMGTDSAAVSRALDEAARDPLAAEALWSAVSARLEGERTGAPTPADSSGNP